MQLISFIDFEINEWHFLNLDFYHNHIIGTFMEKIVNNSINVKYEAFFIY